MCARVPAPQPLTPPLPITDWPGRKRKVTTWIFGMWTTGLGIPLFAVWYQNNKLKG